MSDTAEQPWWADVQHLRPRAAGASVPAPEPQAAGRFARTSVMDSPLETAVAVAIAEDLPRLHDIEWHDFIDSHAELDDVVGGDVWTESPEPARPTVEIDGRGDRATIGAIDAEPEIRTTRRRSAPPAPGERFHAHPDRVALWAFLLGVVLMLVAALGAPEADAAVRVLAGA